jgi:Regulator of Chromosome Condensation (RCC1) repeat protein
MTSRRAYANGCALVTLSLFLAGCGADRPAPNEPRSVRSRPAPAISDGAHQGNAHFFLLPPLVPAPTYTGMSDGSLSPVVSVCEWNPNANTCASIVAQFATAAGTGSTTVRYDATAQQYVVNWKTDVCVTGPCALDPAKQYRIRIVVGASELGYADVTVVANASALKNINTGETIGLVDGRTLPVKFRIEQGAVSVLNGNSASIGSTGGSVTTADGSAALDFPPSALAQSTAITVSATTGQSDFAPTVDLGPNGTQFTVPVRLTLPYEPARLPPGARPADLAIYTYDGTGWMEVPNGFVDEANATVSAPISHFSVYTVYLRPNTVSGTPTPTTIKVGATTVATAYAWAYTTVSGYTYCYPVYSYSYSWGAWYRYVSGWQCYTTPTRIYTYPASGYAVSWASSNSAIASVAIGPTYTDVTGAAQSPPIVGRAPGSAGVQGSVAGLTSGPLPITVLGQLGLLPRIVDVVAGWSVRQQVTQTVALPYAFNFSLTNRNGFLLIGEPGTANYTYGGQTGSYALASGSLAKDLIIAGLNGPGVDTLIASAPGFVPDTAVITVVKGKFIVAGWPTDLVVGDSAAVTLTVADVNGGLGNLAYPIDVAVGPVTGLVFTNGQAAITSVHVQQRTSATFWVKATSVGAGSARFTHRDYLDYANTINVRPPAIVGAQSVCGHTVTGIGYDGTYYFVGEGHDGLLQCLSRFSASTGYLVDTKQVYLDHRGVHWVQSLGALTSRTWGGPIYKIDYATGTLTQIASNPTAARPGDEQSQPAVDADGQSYWILNAGQAERHRLSDHTLLKSFPVTTTATNNVIAASNDWVFVLDGSAANAYSKVSGALAGRQPLPHPHGCNYYGFGVSASADRIMYLRDCQHVDVVPVTVTITDPPPQVAAAGKSSCAKRADGSIACWGESSYGATAPSAGTFATIGAGFFHYCGIKTDQTLSCWGYDGDGRASPPSGTFRQLSTAAESNCALRTDNTPACWGFANDGRISPPSGTYKLIGLGWYHGCGIRSDDTLVCWGHNEYGQSTAPGGTFIEVAGGAVHTCAIRTDQTLVCFGDSPAPPAGTFTHVSASMGGHTCAIRTDGTLACWGQNNFGQATPPAGQFLQVSAAWQHSCAVRVDRRIVCWGFNDTGALNVPSEFTAP